ncbi:MAG: dNTP triphosphohydrolase, partial [Elusimicrobiota bacterium]|nr:dNTP triphosphohydrolase [Elusimicrobiota bacterium]
MDIRKTVEKWEEKNFSRHATRSSGSRGRENPEEPCPVRTEFQKDRDKILHSLSFRLLKHKTQVYLSTTGEDFRTRLTHTLEVAAVGRYIAKALNLNQDLVEAMALGHDLGHTPFGHIGEKALNELTPFRFNHARQSARVARRIEDHGRGLNLTYEVLEGIKNHSKGDSSVYNIYDKNLKNTADNRTIEGEILQFADWIAYINHDVDDSFNMGLISKEDLPASTTSILGFNFQQRIITMIKSVIKSSFNKEHIHMEPEVMKATDR